MQKILFIYPADNLMIALKNLSKNEKLIWKNNEFHLIIDVPAKHKFATKDLYIGDIVYIYGTPVGKATKVIKKGEVVTTQNIKHYAASVEVNNLTTYQWNTPDVSKWKDRSFKGYVRSDGRVATANHWLIIPLVFCENRNALKLQEALAKPLGYSSTNYESITKNLLTQYTFQQSAHIADRPFMNIDGIRAITVNSGCGGTAHDATTLCRVLAAYADHPNTAGITVFALGCEKSQVEIFNAELKKRNSNFNKPYLFFRQHEWADEQAMMNEAIQQTFNQLKIVNNVQREAVPLSKLKLVVKCGGSDGFSGISANPAIGIVSDIIVALGGGSALAEFPELCGAENDIAMRCTTIENKKKVYQINA